MSLFTYITILTKVVNMFFLRYNILNSYKEAPSVFGDGLLISFPFYLSTKIGETNSVKMSQKSRLIIILSYVTTVLLPHRNTLKS